MFKFKIKGKVGYSILNRGVNTERFQEKRLRLTVAMWHSKTGGSFSLVGNGAPKRLKAGDRSLSPLQGKIGLKLLMVSF